MPRQVVIITDIGKLFTNIGELFGDIGKQLDLPVSVNYLPIPEWAWPTDIGKQFTDISKSASFHDIGKWITDICKLLADIGNWYKARSFADIV